jgi:hypothetical protein
MAAERAPGFRLCEKSIVQGSPVAKALADWTAGGSGHRDAKAAGSRRRRLSHGGQVGVERKAEPKDNENTRKRQEMTKGPFKRGRK